MAKDKIYILVGTFLVVFYLSYTIMISNYKQHILSPAKVRKVSYLLDEFYVISVYLHIFGWRGHEVYETPKGGGGGKL
jgi:hypothetical protein